MAARRKLVQRVPADGKSEDMEPETLEGFLVPDELQKSIDGDRFMISDNEDGSEQGMISATNESLRRLSDTKVWGNRWNACDCAGIVSTTCDYS